MNSIKNRIAGFSRSTTILLDIGIILSIFLLVLSLEWLTDFDEVAINWFYHTRASAISEYAANGMLMVVLFGAYAIHRSIRYKRLLDSYSKTEEHYLTTQQHLRMMLDNSTTIVYTAQPGPGSGTSYISGNVTAILGYQPEEFYQPDFWLQIIDPRDHEMVMASFAEFYQKNYLENEVRIRHKDGHLVWILNRIHLLRDELDNPKEVIGTWLDITERKRSEEAVQRSEQRFQKAAKATRDVIYDWDLRTDICWLNDQHYEVFGYANACNSVNGMQWWSSKIHPEDRDDVLKSLNEVLANKRECWNGEYRFRRSDGSYANILDRSLISYDSEGNPVDCIGTMSDLTSVKKVEAELLEAKEKAEHSAQCKTEFLANMSHEIRTPLNGIIGMTDMVLETSLSPEQQHYINVIQSSSTTLLGLINDILDFSKIDAGKLELDPAIFSMRDDLPRALQALAFRASEKDLEFICRIDNDVPGQVIGDELRLQQIITNLLSNAIKFTTQGEVSLRVSTKAVTEGHLMLQFTVSDTGIGIPTDRLPYVFDKFMQVDASVSRQFGGTGLGLPIAKKLVELMGGSIWVESKEGAGTSFHFTARFDRLSTYETEHTVIFPILQDTRVLIVEDNKATAEYLHEIVHHAGMKPTVVHNGKDAVIELMRAARLQKPYSLLLLDITLPGQVDGFDVADAVKNEPLLNDVGIIVVTISQKISDRQRFASLGVVDYISKPFCHSDLFHTMEKLLANRQTQKRGTEINRESATVFNVTECEEGNALKILVAEDNKVNQEVVMSILTKRGHEVHIANNGLEAVRMLVHDHFDMVLMDVQMPVMNGYEATQKIRGLNHGTKRNIPIIGLTANVMDGDREKCLKAGMNEYVSKPVNIKKLMATIGKVCDKAPGKHERKTATATGSNVKLKVNLESLLEKLNGNKTVVGSCLNLLRDEVPQMLAGLDMAIRQNKPAEVRALCHTLRGSLATMEMHAASRVVACLEANLETAPLETKLKNLGQLRIEIEEGIAAVQGVL